MKKFQQAVFAKEALDFRYGFSPSVKDIIIISRIDDGSEMYCRVRGREYHIETIQDGTGIYDPKMTIVIEAEYSMNGDNYGGQ